jgi:hypothetical protein
MNHLTTTRLARIAGVALALFAGSAVAAALPRDHSDRKVAIVAAGNSASIATVKDVAQAHHAPIRVVRTYAEQLGAAHLLAASGYDEIVTVGIDERIAVTPVAQRYPGTRFVTANPREVARALQDQQ